MLALTKSIELRKWRRSATTVAQCHEIFRAWKRFTHLVTGTTVASFTFAQPNKPAPRHERAARRELTVMNWNADENNAGGTEQQSSDATNTTPTEERRPRRRGFAAMDRDRVKEIASKGGKAAHAAGTAHQFSSDEARVAGRKGGMAPHVRRGGVRRRPNGESAVNTTPMTGQGDQSGDNR